MHMGCYFYMNAIVDFVHVSNWKVAMQQFHSLCWSNWKPFMLHLHNSISMWTCKFLGKHADICSEHADDICSEHVVNM